MKRGRLYLFLAAVLASTAVGTYVGRQFIWKNTPPTSISAADLNSLYTARFPDIEGKPREIAEWEGKTLVVNFWATWCPPCREEMPGFSRLQLKYDKSVQFVGISIDSAGKVREFASQLSITYPLLMADNKGIELSRMLGNERMGLPYTVVLGPKREIRLIHTGRLAEDELDRILKKYALN